MIKYNRYTVPVVGIQKSPTEIELNSICMQSIYIEHPKCYDI